MYSQVPSCHISTCQVKILSCLGIRMVKWWVLSNFVSLLTLPDQVARPDWKWKSFPIMSGHVPWSLQQIASPLIILYNPIYATTQCARILQRKFVFELYIFAIIQMKDGTTWKNFPFPDEQNPLWWHSWHFGQCLVCTIPEYTGGIIISHLLHSRYDKDDKVLEVEIERSSVWSNLELEAPTCAGRLDISFFPPHLTLWRNSFQFWPEDRLVGFITPPAPLDFRLIGSQAICCRLFFC